MLLTVKPSLLLLSKYHQTFQRNFLSKQQSEFATKHSVLCFQNQLLILPSESRSGSFDHALRFGRKCLSCTSRFVYFFLHKNWSRPTLLRSVKLNNETFLWKMFLLEWKSHLKIVTSGDNFLSYWYFNKIQFWAIIRFCLYQNIEHIFWLEVTMWTRITVLCKTHWFEWKIILTLWFS